MSVVSLEMAINKVPGASVVSIVVNRSRDTKGDMPPHSVRITVDGGYDREIAHAIYEVTPLKFSRPSLWTHSAYADCTINPCLVGNVAVTIPPHGYVIRFSRPKPEQDGES